MSDSDSDESYDSDLSSESSESSDILLCELCDENPAETRCDSCDGGRICDECYEYCDYCGKICIVCQREGHDGEECKRENIKEAAQTGDLKLLNSLLENETINNALAFTKLLKHGHVKYAIEIYNKNPDVIKNDESFECICEKTVKTGQVKSLQWLHQNGFPWNQLLFITNCTRTTSRQNTCLIYAYTNRCPGYEKYHQYLKNHLLNKNMKILVNYVKIIRPRLKKYIRKFIERYYSPTGKEYFIRKEHFSKLI